MEVEGLLAVHIPHRHAVIMPVGAAPVRFGQVFHNLLDGIEAVYDEMIAQWLPALVLAALYADIDQDKWFVQKPLAYHPPREVGLLVERKIHFDRLFLMLAATRPPCLHSGRIDSNLSKHTIERS